MQVPPLGWEDPLEEEMATTPVFLPGESHGRRSLEDYSPQGCRVDMTAHKQYRSLLGSAHMT